MWGVPLALPCCDASLSLPLRKMYQDDSDSKLNLEEERFFNRELADADLGSLLTPPVPLVDSFPVTLPHVDDCSDDDIALACLVPPATELADSSSLPPTDALASYASPLQSRHDLASSPSTPLVCAPAEPSPLKRRRLRFKQALPDAYAVSMASGNVVPSDPLSAVGTYGISGSGVFHNEVLTVQVYDRLKPEKEFRLMSARCRYDYVYEKVRGFWSRYLVASSLLALPAYRESGLAGGEAYPRGFVRKLFKELTPELRREAAQAWVSCSSGPLYVRQAVDSVFPERRSFPNRRGCVFLFTFIGPWSQMSSPDGVTPVSLPPLHDEVKRLRRDPHVASLWARAILHSKGMKLKMAATDFAVCLEVCPETFETTGKLQLHVHLCLRSGAPMKLGRVLDYAFDGAVPCVAHTIGGLGSGMARNSWSAFFYCIVEKYGHVCHHATRRPFKDFLVNPNWVMNLLQSRKLSSRVARELVVTSCSGATRLLRELDTLEAEEEKERLSFAWLKHRQSLRRS